MRRKYGKVGERERGKNEEGRGGNVRENRENREEIGEGVGKIQKGMGEGKEKDVRE